MPTTSNRITKPLKRGGVRRASRNKPNQQPSPTLQTKLQALSPQQKAKPRPRPPQEQPLIERTNNLPLDEFINLYVAQEDLSITAKAQLEPQQEKQEQKQTYALDLYTAASLPARVFEQCFALIEETSATAYRASSIGWSPPKKRSEMRLPDMKYLVLRRASSGGEGGADSGPEADAEADVLGFLSFMVTYEDGFEVVYCYEVHLAAAMQRQGLGAQLMRVFLRIGERVGMQKAMLTVFRANGAAIRFYERLGFRVDESSPRPRRLRNGTVKDPDYRILSRVYDQ
ncbi:N-terminal L-serine N(alpha)-acetyltransferase NAT4 [Aspergillus homomorphus CBS 101889]|uniref:N-alpha-acetyltransferase 40 n=1 Tax=Aspergillus homomorphus (strain CBS 101889) TaxID=1450537 RepID=A0A395I6X7_ASPHC|nr:acyl-CoA N-acyltransferase [Aspergillus homomorphus CBS 101889]RAL15940.1 acyl-CoA N-acyltransferase [Aspergillus homomorphus CBS 101889]